MKLKDLGNKIGEVDVMKLALAVVLVIGISAFVIHQNNRITDLEGQVSSQQMAASEQAPYSEDPTPAVYNTSEEDKMMAFMAGFGFNAMLQQTGQMPSSSIFNQSNLGPVDGIGKSSYSSASSSSSSSIKPGTRSLSLPEFGVYIEDSR